MDFRVGRTPFPIIAVLGAAVFLWAPWFVAKATFFVPLSLDLTVADMMRGSLPTSLWFWATVIGFAVVLAVGLSPSDSARILAPTGGVLILAFPAWSLWKILTDGGNIDEATVSPGWGLFATLVVGALVIYLGSKLEEW